MAIESISAQSKIVMTQVPGVTGAGSLEMLADNSLVQLFPQNRKPSSESTAGSVEQVSAMVDDLQASLELLQHKHTQLNFSVHEKTDRIMVRITDQDTGDVIREVPSEEFLDMAAKLQEMVGLMFDMRV